MRQSSDSDEYNRPEAQQKQFPHLYVYDDPFHIYTNYSNHFRDQSFQIYPQSQQINITQEANSIIPEFIENKRKTLFDLKHKPILNIETTVDQNYLSVIMCKDPSNKLNEYLKTKIKQFLETQLTTHRLDQLDRQKIERYFSENQSFASMKILFGIPKPTKQKINENKQCDKIRKQCYKYFNSINFLKIVIATKNKYIHKIMEIKYLHRMPLIIVKPHKYKKWKQK